jgi:hypothetical protein
MLRRSLPVAALLFAAACADTGVPTTPADNSPDVGAASFKKDDADKDTRKLFKDYVAMGSSIAAGFMSGGINETTQLQAYPVLLAAAAGVKFDVALLALPGCPPLYTAPITLPLNGNVCAGRSNNAKPPQLNSVAISGETVAEAMSLTPDGQSAILQPLMLGNMTQVQAMLAAKPTFVSVGLGDNDAFGAALGGSLTELTPLNEFAASYAAIVAAMTSNKKLEGAVLIGVIDPVLAAPVLQPGAYFYIARDVATGRFLGKPVNANCSPVTALGQPNPLAANLVSYLMVANPNFPEINCDPAAYPLVDPRRGAFLLDAAEIVAIRTRVAQFNAVIAAAAAANGWAYVDPNAIVLAGLAARGGPGGSANLIRKCQDLATATTAAALQAAVLLTCPVPGLPTSAPNLFGALISFDGVHPSAIGQVALANLVAAAVNAKYGTSLQLN